MDKHYGHTSRYHSTRSYLKDTNVKFISILLAKIWDLDYIFLFSTLVKVNERVVISRCFKNNLNKLFDFKIYIF